MRFSEKLVCTILLVVVTFFALGGSALLYGDFRDRLSASAVQEQNSHSMICYTLESEMLTLHRQGEAVTAEVLREFCAELLETEDNTTTQLAALYRTDGETAEGAVYSSMPAVWGKNDLPGSGQDVVLRNGDSLWRVYGTDLLDDWTLYTAYDLSEVFAARARSLQRFLLLEAAVVIGAAVAAFLFSRRLIRPLALLNRASRQIAAGNYALRTDLHTDDEIGQLSESFDTMAAAVQEKVAALELSVQQREDFMGAFTHELKTPMTGILGCADLLRSMQPDPEEQREAAGAIYHEAHRLENLSVKLLQLLHLDEEELTLVPLNLDKVVARAIQAARPALEQNGNARAEAIPTGLWVMGDGDLLCDLVLNLISNAAKAGPGGLITITAEQVGKTVLLRVRDRGCGIPADQLTRVTEPFYMVDKSRARKQGGSGLGLALCSRIAQAHGGTLTIESEPGKGTAVTVNLQIAEKPEQGGAQ